MFYPSTRHKQMRIPGIEAQATGGMMAQSHFWPFTLLVLRLYLHYYLSSIKISMRILNISLPIEQIKYLPIKIN